MSHQVWLEQADAYGLGALDGDELRAFEQHLAGGCVECIDRVDDARAAAALLVRGLPTEPVSPLTRRMVMRSISSAPIRRSKGISWQRVAAMASALAACLVIALLVWDDVTLRARVRNLDAEIAAQRGDIAKRKEVYRLLEDPNIVTVALAGAGPGKGATGRVLWSPSTKTGLVMTRSLPAAPAGKRYAVWAVNETETISIAKLEVDHAGRAQSQLRGLESLLPSGRFVVTLEDENSTTSPRGPVYLFGVVPPIGTT